MPELKSIRSFPDNLSEALNPKEILSESYQIGPMFDSYTKHYFGAAMDPIW